MMLKQTQYCRPRCLWYAPQRLLLVGSLMIALLPGQRQNAYAQTADRTRVAPVFQDDFESGKYSRKQPGGTWQGGGSGNVHVGPGGAESSAFALDLIHRAKPPQGMSSAEQRFVLTDGLSEIWLEYDFYLPANFYHRGKGNNKFLALWEEKYAGLDASGTTPSTFFLIEFRPMNDLKKNEGRPGDSYLYVNARLRSTGKMRRVGTALNALTDKERGRWNQVRLHIRLPSDDGKEDGIVELRMNGKPIISNNRAPVPSKAGGHYIRHGYFLGWANSGYSEDTHFKVDNVRVYGSNPGW